jgi:hypothetical protein
VVHFKQSKIIAGSVRRFSEAYFHKFAMFGEKIQIIVESTAFLENE